MNSLLTNSFSVESKEAQELINNIKTSYAAQDKEAFLNTKTPFVEAALAASSDEEKVVFNHNVYQLLLQLPETTTTALIQVLISQRQDNVAFLNEILGDSDDVFYLLKNINEKLEKANNEEYMIIRKGKAFYQQ